MDTRLTERRRRSGVRVGATALVTAVRPKHWVKNLLVYGAPAAAGMLFSTTAMFDATLAFFAFTLAASGTYLINDTIDAPLDRLHPVKRHRPVAAGVVAPGTALVFAVALLAASLVPTAILGEAEFAAALLAYIVLTVSYSLWLKQIAVVDLVVVAAGFGLRAVGGAFAISVPVSRWFLIVSFFGALFIVAGKRFGEGQSLGEQASRHRPSLSDYDGSFAQHVMSLSSGITFVGFGLWAHDQGFLTDWWFLASLMFLVMTLLRFALLVHAGASDDPVEIAWSDRPLRVVGFVFLVLVVTGIQFG